MERVYRNQIVFFLLLACSVVQAREFNTERPDKARLAYTLEKNKIALEPEFVNYIHQEDGSEVELGEVYLRYGLSDSTELQLVVDTFVRQNDKRGFGNTEIALKFNLMGNDEGNVALALIPHVYAPTASADLSGERWEGGLAFAMDSLIYNKYYFSVTIEPNNVRRRQELDWQTNLITVASLG